MAEPFALPFGEGRVSASIGIAVFQDDATTLNTLLKAADQAKYRANESGRQYIQAVY